LDGTGNIYFAAAGEKRSGGGSPSVAISIPGPSPTPAPSGAAVAATPGRAPESTVMLNPSSTGVAGGSEIYKLATDGSPARLWNSRDDLVYSLAFDEKGHLLAGTGNRGQIIEVIARDDYIDLMKAGANQVTAFTKAADGGIYVSSSNLGKIFLLSSA